MNPRGKENKKMEQKEQEIEEVKTCPICNKEYTGIGAISRQDDTTEICSNCGRQEAQEIYKQYLEAESEKK